MTLLKLVKTLAVTAFAVITTLTVVSCKKETDNKPSDHTAEPSSTAVSSDIVTDVPTAEPTPAPVITKGNFNLDDIAAGDKVSVFTVETVETKDDIKTIVFNGILTVNGLLSKNDDGTCYFTYTEEFASFLPTPDGKEKEGHITLDKTKALEIFGAEEGAFSMTVRDYTLTVSEKITESVTEFEKQESDYGIIS